MKALKVIAIYDFLFNSKSTYQAPFRAKNVAFFCDTPTNWQYMAIYGVLQTV